MAQVTLQRMLEEIKTLEPEELQEVERAVQQRLEPASKQTQREAMLRVLEQSGLVKQIKRPPMVVGSERRLVPIQGKPLSETIIEERR